jgi:hypothetical protein
MEYIGNRISIKRTEKEISIIILALSEKKKNILLFAWLFVWTVSGFVVLAQYLMMTDKDAKVMLMVWLGFWAYFEYKSFIALMWRKFGVEKIKLRDNKLFYKKEIAGKGKIRVYEFDFIKELRIAEFKENSFADNMSSAYWVVGGEKLAFDYYGKEIKFAFQLNEQEAASLHKLIKKEISK